MPSGGWARVCERHDEGPRYPGPHAAMGGRRLEVIADGLPFVDGAQLALDTTMVSPLHRDGTAKRGTSVRGGAVLQEARRRKERTYPELHRWTRPSGCPGSRSRGQVVGGDCAIPPSPCQTPRPASSKCHASAGAVRVVEALGQFVGLQRCQGFSAVVVGQATSWGWWGCVLSA